MGLFRRGKGKSWYRRRRADLAPDGWIEAQAVVDACETEKTSTRMGASQGAHDHVFRTRTTYVVLDQDGQPLPIVVEAKLRSSDLPKQGERLVIAYQPANPTDIVVLVSETEYGDRLRSRVRQAIQDGTEAPCEVFAATTTGRMSHPAESPEVRLDLRVTPTDGGAFDVSTSLWDRGFGLKPGTRGTLFYVEGEGELGYPVFPDALQQASDDDPVRLARDEFVQKMAGGTTQVAPGLTISSGGSTPLDG